MAPTYDVIVLGLGGMGSAAAHHLAARGARVLGLEKFGPVHNRGSSHGGSRITRQSYFEDPAYVPLLLRSYELYEKLERDTGREIATLCGGVMVGRPDSRTVSGSLESARQWDLPHEMLDAKEIRRRFPTLTPADDEVALYEARAGLVRPEYTVAAHVQLATQDGAELHFEEPVTRWEELPGGAGVRVHTPEDTYTAGQLVICPGAWAPQLLTDLGVPFTIERQVMYWFAPDGGTAPVRPRAAPDLHLGGRAGRPDLRLPVDRRPRRRREGRVLPQGHRLHPGDHRTHRARPRGACHGRPDRARGIPALPGRFLKAATCMYSNTPDEHFVITRHPAHPETVTVACGFSGHGFKFVPVVGEIVADLALTGGHRAPHRAFRPAPARRRGRLRRPP